MNKVQLQQLSLQAATVLTDGAILVDEWSPLIFDDVLRESRLWQRISKDLAPGETTSGFNQTGVPTARAADPRSLGYTATSATRSESSRKDIRAIVSNVEFGIFNRSVYQQQGKRWGDLQMKDVKDMVTANIREWQRQAYVGNHTGVPEEFDGLRLLLPTGTTVPTTDSIILAINTKIVAMQNQTTRAVMPSAIYMNGRTLQMIEQEFLSVGNKLQYSTFNIGGNPFQIPYLPTAAGLLPMFVDPWNSAIAGTPDVYPTFIISEDKLQWQYVQVLGAPGPEPQTFEIALTNQIVQQYATIMFGALEMLGGTGHHARLNVYDRTTPIKPSSNTVAS